MATPGKKRSAKRNRALELFATGRYTVREVATRLELTYGLLRAWLIEDGIDPGPLDGGSTYADVKRILKEKVPSMSWKERNTIIFASTLARTNGGRR